MRGAREEKEGGRGLQWEQLALVEVGGGGCNGSGGLLALTTPSSSLPTCVAVVRSLTVGRTVDELHHPSLFSCTAANEVGRWWSHGRAQRPLCGQRESGRRLTVTQLSTAATVIAMRSVSSHPSSALCYPATPGHARLSHPLQAVLMQRSSALNEHRLRGRAISYACAALLLLLLPFTCWCPSPRHVVRIVGCVLSPARERSSH